MSSGKTDEVKGRLKEAVGVLSGDERLEREGKGDRTAGVIKQKVAQVFDQVRDAMRRAEGKSGPGGEK